MSEQDTTNEVEGQTIKGGYRNAEAESSEEPQVEGQLYKGVSRSSDEDKPEVEGQGLRGRSDEPSDEPEKRDISVKY